MTERIKFHKTSDRISFAACYFIVNERRIEIDFNHLSLKH